MRTCGYRIIIIFSKQIQQVMSWVKLYYMLSLSDEWFREKIPQFTIFLQSTIGCFVNVRNKLLTFQMKSRNLINREGFSRISSQLAIYEEVENWECFEKKKLLLSALITISNRTICMTSYSLPINTIIVVNRPRTRPLVSHKDLDF